MFREKRHAIPNKLNKRYLIEDIIFNCFLAVMFSLSLVIIALTFALFFVGGR